MCALVRNDSVVRGVRSPLQIPIFRTTERYRAGQGGNENRPRSSRLGRPPCGQIPIYSTTERYRAGQGGNENRPRSSRLVSGDSPPNSNLPHGSVNKIRITGNLSALLFFRVTFYSFCMNHFLIHAFSPQQARFPVWVRASGYPDFSTIISPARQRILPKPGENPGMGGSSMRSLPLFLKPGKPSAANGNPVFPGETQPASFREPYFLFLRLIP